MQQWLESGIHQVDAWAKQNQEYQRMLRELEQVEDAYRRLLHNLPQEEQELLERYITLCEELEYQRTCAAYYCGKQNRAR